MLFLYFNKIYNIGGNQKRNTKFKNVQNVYSVCYIYIVTVFKYVTAFSVISKIKNN